MRYDASTMADGRKSKWRLRALVALEATRNSPAACDSKRKWRWLAVAWFALAMLLAAAAAIQFPANESYRARATAYIASDQKTRAMERQALLNAWKRLHASDSPEHMPLHDFEEVLNNGLPLRQDAASGHVRWRDPASGGEVLFPISGGIVSPYAASGANATPLGWPRDSYFEAVTDIRRFAYIGGYVAWVLAFFFLLTIFADLQPSGRLVYAQVLLMIATASTCLSLLGTHYWRVWNEFFQDDAAGVGWVELTITLLLLVLLRHRRRHTDAPAPHCARCDYNLTGNISGRCPECGTAVPLEASK